MNRVVNPTAESSSQRQERIAIEAANWLAPGLLSSPAQREKLMRWLAQSPDHVKEFLAATTWSEILPAELASWRTDASAVLAESNVIHVPERTSTEVATGRGKRARTAFLGYVSAAAAAVVLVAATPIVRDLWMPNVYATSIGEQRTVALSDGSVVAMNTQSRIRVDYSPGGRDVYLSAGQAMFDVAHDATRPFRVHVYGGAIVQAVGTKFDVRRMSDRTSVAVLEGRVQITRPHETRTPSNLTALLERTRLAAGEAVSVFDEGSLTPPARIDVAEVNAWQQRRLVFRDDTLADILAEFHRYNRTEIRVEGDDLGARRYSGVWDADHPEDLLRYLHSDGTIRVDSEGDGFVLRSAAPPVVE